MFYFVILICRYLFVIFILYFLWEGVAFLLNERNIKNWDPRYAVAKQKGLIILMHLTGFLILGYETGALTFKWKVLAIAGVGLLFLVIGQVLVRFLYKDSCPLMWNGIFFLLDLGLITLQRLDPDGVQRQFLFMALGFATTLLVPLVFRLIPKLENLKIIYLSLCFLLLILPFFFGSRTFGALNWITIGGVSIQPSEIVKFFFVFYLASALRPSPSDRSDRSHLLHRQLIAPIVVAGVFVCTLTLQKDLGGALIFFMTFMIMLYIATGQEILFFSGIGLAAGAAWLVSKFASHVQTRIIAWLDPWSDPFDRGHQILQSLFAITSGGLLGSGLTRGAPGYVPVVKSDFIFAAICEEFGGLFGIGVFAIFVMIFYRGVHIALRCTRPYYSLLASGFTSMLALQTFLILGGVIKFIPMTGVTLPFISSGGSSVVVSILMIGILQWIHVQNQKENAA